METEKLQETIKAVREEVRKIVIGQEAVVDLALVAILTNGHVLLEGVPGVAKTLLVKTLAKILGCDFARIQFTPDLMPSDVTGTNVFNLKEHDFTLIKGPIFTTFLLADEINRAPAKTQAALLQAMQERAVTIDRETHPLPANFTVFATQNPIEFEGTYPLPEAQKDRFMLKVTMLPMEKEEEIELARRTLGNDSPERVLERGTLRAVLTSEDLVGLRGLMAQVTVRDELLNYVVELTRKSRNHETILLGAGPRATQALLLGARAHAAVRGRDFVTPDDVKVLARPTLEHRLVLRPEFEVEGISTAEVIDKLLQETPVPR